MAAEALPKQTEALSKDKGHDKMKIVHSKVPNGRKWNKLC